MQSYMHIGHESNTKYHCLLTAKARYEQTDIQTVGKAISIAMARWLSGRASDLRSKGRGFEPRP